MDGIEVSNKPFDLCSFCGERSGDLISLEGGAAGKDEDVHTFTQGL